MRIGSIKTVEENLLAMLISATAISGPNVSRPPVPSSKSERENLCMDLDLGGDDTESEGLSVEDGSCKVSASDVAKGCSSANKETGESKFIR